MRSLNITLFSILFACGDAPKQTIETTPLADDCLLRKHNSLCVDNQGCVLPDGQFLAHYEPLHGNTCGVIPDTVVDSADSQKTLSDCIGLVTDIPMGDGCKIRVDVDCGGVQITQTIIWADGYTGAEGTSYIHTDQCSGSYKVTISIL